MTTDNPLLDIFTQTPGGDIDTAAFISNFAARSILCIRDPASIPNEDFTQTPWEALYYNGKIFSYDPADSTTAHDGISAIVSQDGRRYKIDTDFSVKATAIDKDLTAPPASPTIGDQYLVPDAPSGDWASNAKDLTVYTRRGWLFVAPFVGMQVYVQDENQFYVYKSTAVWEPSGVSALANGSIVTKALANKFGYQVEAEQAAPPGSVPANGTAYIVGASATGAWTTHDGEIAEAEGGSWLFFAANNGDRVFDKAADIEKRYESSTNTWVAADTPSQIVSWGYFPGSYSANVTGANVNVPCLLGFSLTLDPTLFDILIRGGGGGGFTTLSGIFLDAQTVRYAEYNPAGTLITPPDGNQHQYNFVGRTTVGNAGVFAVENVLVEVRRKPIITNYLA